jgi:integrase
LAERIITVGESKTDAGSGRRIPMSDEIYAAAIEYAKWYTEKFGASKPDWYVFPFGSGKRKDPTRPQTTLKTAWTNARNKAEVQGRFHDNRHTFVTDLAESGTGDEVIRDMAGHVSKEMLKHYSHIRMQAKRRAIAALTTKLAEPKPEEGRNSGVAVQDSVQVSLVN